MTKVDAPDHFQDRFRTLGDQPRLRMKTSGFTRSILALVLLTTAAGAFAQDSETESSPNLEETMAWIKEKFTLYGGGSHLIEVFDMYKDGMAQYKPYAAWSYERDLQEWYSGNRSIIDHASEAVVAGCRLTHRYDVVLSYRDVKTIRSTFSFVFIVDLSEVDPRTVEARYLKWQEYPKLPGSYQNDLVTYGNGLYLRNYSSLDGVNPLSSLRTIVSINDEVLDMETDGIGIPFHRFSAEIDLGNRLAKALQHAATLCKKDVRKKKEAF